MFNRIRWISWKKIKNSFHFFHRTEQKIVTFTSYRNHPEAPRVSFSPFPEKNGKKKVFTFWGLSPRSDFTSLVNGISTHGHFFPFSIKFRKCLFWQKKLYFMIFLDFQFIDSLHAMIFLLRFICDKRILINPRK